MSDQEDQNLEDENPTPETAEADSASVSVEDQPQENSADAVDESVPDFPELSGTAPSPQANHELSRFSGVQVDVTAELGRTRLTIQEMLGLSEGAVLELNRAISAPVELVAQGVPLGNGEVVVVDDRFAIRIKEIYQS